MSEPREVFIEKLMAHVLHLTMIPKVQIERAIGPILGLFIEDLLLIQWGKKVEIISEEFPLRIGPMNCLSTNIDWLLYNHSDKQLVFLELKTAYTSFNQEQEDTYCNWISKINESGSKFLVEDLKDIGYASQEPEKYAKVLTRVQEKPCYSECKEAKLLYLAPAAMRDARRRPSKCEVEWLSFEELPDEMSGPLALEWRVIRRTLVKLGSKRPRNGAQDGGERRNYGGTSGYEEVMGLCEEKGNTIVIGFNGGAEKLRTSSLDELKKRQAFKWDLAEGGTGVKGTRNWIHGQKFLEIVEGLMDD